MNSNSMQEMEGINAFTPIQEALTIYAYVMKISNTIYRDNIIELDEFENWIQMNY